MLNLLKFKRPPSLPQLATTPWLFRWGISASLSLVILFCTLTQLGGMWRIAAGIESTLQEARQQLGAKLNVVSLQESSLHEGLRAQLTVLANRQPSSVLLPASHALLAWNSSTNKVSQWSGGLAPPLSIRPAVAADNTRNFQLSQDGAYLLVSLYLTPAQATAWNAHWLFLAVPLSTLTNTFSVCDCQWSIQTTDGVVAGNLKHIAPSQIEYTVPKYSLWDALDVPYLVPRHLAVQLNTQHGLQVKVAFSYETMLSNYRSRVQATWFLTLTLSALFSLGYLGFVLLVWSLSDTDKWLRRIATTDELTNLPNRRNFEYILKHESSTITALGLLDVNDFKTINDTYGHANGDVLLATIAKRLKHQTRTRSDTVYRLGGDEFAVVMRGPLTKEQAGIALQRILLDTFATPLQIGTVSVHSSGSGGIVHISDTTDPTQLYQYADISLYHAKETKGYDSLHQLKNPCCLFDSKLYIEKQNKIAMMARLSQAISSQQHPPVPTPTTASVTTGLHLVFQPKIAYADHSTSTPHKVGYEALARWFDGSGSSSQVSPFVFIPLIEQSGLMPQFGEWILRETLSQLLAWHQQGHGWQKVAINVSAAQLTQPTFHQLVSSLLRHCGIPAACLHIEVTESLLADATCAANIQHLRATGCPIALDDFGTGYSSFDALRRFPIDYLKLDRSFIKEAHTERGAQLCKSIIDTGRAFNMTVIAEGVETISQEEIVRSLGAHQIQGFLFSKGLEPSLAIDYTPESVSPQASLFPPEKTSTSTISPLVAYMQIHQPSSVPVPLEVAHPHPSAPSTS